jgi:integrase
VSYEPPVSLHDPTGLVAAACAHGIAMPVGRPQYIVGPDPKNKGRSLIRGKYLDAMGKCVVCHGAERPHDLTTPANNPATCGAPLDDWYDKSARIRATPISEEAVEALRAHRGKTPRYGLDEPVFLGPRTKERLRGSTVSHAFPRLLERAGLPRMTVHQLRHGHATLLLAQGVPMRVIADQLGHADPGFTARVYSHVVPSMQNAAVKGLKLRRVT